MAERAENSARADRTDAAQELAAEIATRAEPAVAAALTGGRGTQVDSETAHRIAAAVARDRDRGHVRSTAEYVREAQRRR